MSSWIPFNNGLPNVEITEFDFDGPYIYVATYGRGIWRSLKYSSCPVNVTLTSANDPSSPVSTGVQRYSVSGTIVSTRIITGGAGTDVIYSADDFIRLDPGFEVRSWNLFEANLDGCPD